MIGPGLRRPVPGPPVEGEWVRSELTLGVQDGHWTSLRTGSHEWLAAPVREVVTGDGTSDARDGAERWEPAAEAVDRLGLPIGADGWRTDIAGVRLTRTIQSLSGAARLGYRVSTLSPWSHRVELALAPGGHRLPTDPAAGLFDGPGWARTWLLADADALALHWTTDQPEDWPRLRLGEGERAELVQVGIGAASTPVPPRRDLAWRLVLSAWRR